MGKVTLIIGGARSGKSSQAQRLAKDNYKRVAFIATCMPLDKEMKRRVKLHKDSRPSSWETFEDPKDICVLLKKIGNKFELIIIDCLTLWVSNFSLIGLKDKQIEDNAKKLGETLKNIKADSILVSNEVGLGIVPNNKLARDFRDVAGKVNQIIAREASEVLFMVAGLPLKIK